MNSKDLQYIITIAETKNFSQAAKQLFVSQPALSQYVKRLEAGLGVQIFFRSHSQVVLTPVGEVFVREGSRILNELNNLEHELRHFSSESPQILSIGVSQFYGKHILSTLISQLKKTIPTYKIKIVEGESKFLENLIKNEQLDFGIFPAPIYNKNVCFAPIYEERILFALNKENKEATALVDRAFHGDGIDLNLYKDFPFILLQEGLKLRSRAAKICLAYGFTPQAVYETENLDTVLSLVENNYGVAMLPSTILKKIDQKKSKVAFYPIKSRYSKRNLGLVYKEGRYADVFLKKILDCAREGMND